jgi:hypothetical protein
MPRAKTSKHDQPMAPESGAPAGTETKVDDAEKNGGVVVATAEKEEAPAPRNQLPRVRR